MQSNLGFWHQGNKSVKVCRIGSLVLSEMMVGVSGIAKWQEGFFWSKCFAKASTLTQISPVPYYLDLSFS